MRASLLNTLARYRVRNEHELKVAHHVRNNRPKFQRAWKNTDASPAALLETEGLLNDNFTAVHRDSRDAESNSFLSRGRARWCALARQLNETSGASCAADDISNICGRLFWALTVTCRSMLFEEARELEYHLRLQKMERAIRERGRPPPQIARPRLTAPSLSYNPTRIARVGARLVGFPPSRRLYSIARQLTGAKHRLSERHTRCWTPPTFSQSI